MKDPDLSVKILEDFFRKVEESNLSREGKNLVKRATLFAVKAHFGQERASGAPFITHPIAVAELLLEIGRSAEEITAGVLHDVVEDTKITLVEIEKDFGLEIVFLVDGMTKVFQPSDISGIEKVFGPQVASAVRETIGVKTGEPLSLVERDIIYQAKLYVMVQKDHRLVFIRLADRVHNMRTLKFLPFGMQRKVAQETLDFHLPLASLFLSPEELWLIHSWLKELVILSHNRLLPDSQVTIAERDSCHV